MSIDNTIATLYAEVLELGPPRPGRRFPPELRDRLQAAVRGMSASWSDREIASSLGLSLETVRRWRRDAPDSVALVQVEVESAPCGLRVVSPRGFAVEGLDLDAAAELMARLG